jgi:hypothetical protein
LSAFVGDRPRKSADFLKLKKQKRAGLFYRSFEIPQILSGQGQSGHLCD